MPRISQVLKYVVIAVSLGVTLYASVYFYTVRSEAFQYANTWIVDSRPYDQFVGRVVAVRVDPWAGFTHHFSGTDRDASMVVVVVGEKASICVDLKLQKRTNKWAVTKATPVAPY